MNIIQRRDLAPVLTKAGEVLRYYEKAANCIVSLLGADYAAVESSRHPKAILFCKLCKHYHQHSGQMAPDEYPCTALHFNAVNEARRLGGSYVYTCPIGFIFWTSPFYFGERFAGALMSSGILAVDRHQAVERIFDICKGEISRQKIEAYLEGIPQKTIEQVKALAQMMLICAEQISETEGRQSIAPEVRPAGGERQAVPSGKTGMAAENTCPQDKERMLLASLRRGDSDEARKILRELLDLLCASSNGNFGHFKLRVIELVVLLSRAAAESENGGDVNVLEENNRYLKKIEESRTLEEITGNLNIIINRMGRNIFSFQGIRHASALRKAERFIWEHYTRKISLREIAGVSGLSAPYFSTVFKEEMGENLSNYLNRLRVEKAAAMLHETEIPISEIASACGFEDQSWFSKIFKNYMNCSPGKFREQVVQEPHGEMALWMNHPARRVPGKTGNTKSAGGAA
jgi:AraC-like DNA-binding protein/ligand-binding sensor protein